MKRSRALLVLAVGLVLLIVISNVQSVPSSNAAAADAIFFDDLDYPNKEQMKKTGWILRTAPGWPGIPGAKWLEENVSFHKDPSQPRNRFVRMTSATDGTTTTQTQICQQRKFLEGTYAARVRFTDRPVSGPGGDQLVESFYSISPLKAPMDLDYSELDFEYLPNGGWGGPELSFYVTTWETVQIEPWNADNTSNSVQGSLAGWHTLVTQVMGGTVRYFMDGKLIAQHGGAYYPDALMSMNFNLWFIDGGLAQVEGVREYQEDIDWVFHEAGVLLMPDEVSARIEELRHSSIKFEDTVLSGIQLSPCDL